MATAADGACRCSGRPTTAAPGRSPRSSGPWKRCAKLAGPRRFLLVGDSKLLSYANIAAMIDAEVTFLAPASKTFVPAAVLAGCDYAAAVAVDYVAERDAAGPSRARGGYRVAEDTMTITGPRKKRPRLHAAAGVRALLGPRRRRRARPGQANSPGPATTWTGCTRGLGSRHYPDAAAVTARLSAIAREPQGRRLPARHRRQRPHGRPTLDWHFDQAAIDAEAATDGWYALLTNLPGNVTAAEVLARYKNQPATIERRYHDLKGPLAVAPMFLHANRRITALIAVICLALLIYSLIEREARRNLAPATTLTASTPAGPPSPPPA